MEETGVVVVVVVVVVRSHKQQSVLLWLHREISLVYKHQEGDIFEEYVYVSSPLFACKQKLHFFLSEAINFLFKFFNFRMLLILH
jgi:hypothetical protein